MRVIDRVGAQQSTILCHEEEEQPVYEAQELAIEVLGSDVSGAHTVWGDLLAQRLVDRVTKEAVGQALDALLDAVAQMLAHAAALIQRASVVLLQ